MLGSFQGRTNPDPQILPTAQRRSYLAAETPRDLRALSDWRSDENRREHAD